MTSTDTVQSATEWSCDEKLGKCRNPHGCHCREISDLQSELTRAREREKDVIERCAKVAEAFDAAANSKHMKAFAAAHLIGAVYDRDKAIAAAIRALAGGKP